MPNKIFAARYGLIAVLVSGALTGCVVEAQPSAAPRDAPTVTVTAPADDATTEPANQTDVNEALPSLPLCRDLEARGYSYGASFRYWTGHGQPDRMDADRNGIPCETVYPASVVAAYFRATPPPHDGLTAGLLCRDLRDRGYGFATALAYWLSEGTPSRMDKDGNGVPCETVYPASIIASHYGRRAAPQAEPQVAPDGPATTGRDLGPGSGYTVTCADGSISHAGGRQGACSHHGGVA
jgi:hypothetical protein